MTEDLLKFSLDIASQLGDVLATLPINDGPEQWELVEQTAQKLATALRIKDPAVDQHTALGKTLLPQTLNTLLKNSVNGSRTPASDKAGATYEILRVAANLCMDHDVNRGALLDAGVPQTIISLLEGYAESIPPNRHFADPLPMSFPDLKIVKTSIGVILNASLGYEPVRTRLLSLEAATTILRLSMAIYPPGSWLSTQSTAPDEKTQLEEWDLRAGLSSWTWRVLSGLKTDAQDALPIFGPEGLPLIVPPLHAFLPPYAVAHGLFANPSPTRENLVSADIEALEESCALLEALCLDVEDVRLSLARGLTFPDEHDGLRCLSDMLAFVDRGDSPPWWTDDPDKHMYERSFQNCKGGVIRAIVEVAGEEKNTDILWDDSEDDKPGGEFVSWMVQWIRTRKVTERDDLIICATLSIANIVRREAHSQAIVKPPISLAPNLAALLGKDIDIKVKHGVIGLLKNLSQSAGNRQTLGQAGIISKLADSEVWVEKSDIVEIVQVSAIGTAKHLSNGNAENAWELLMGSDQNSSGTALEQIMNLVRRSDSVTVKSEGTRVLGNVIKSLTSDPALVDERRKKARTVLATPENASALAALIGRSKKYPMLINEGVVALSFLSTHGSGAVLVIDAVMAPLPHEVQQHSPHANISLAQSGTTSNSEGSPIVNPTRALDVLITVLRHPDSRCPIEVRANICALLSQVCRKGWAGEERGVEVQKIKEATGELMRTFSQGKDLLADAAKRTLEAWG